MWGADDLGVRLTDAQGSWNYWTIMPHAVQRTISARLAAGRSVILHAFGKSRHHFEAEFGRPANYAPIVGCIFQLNAAVHEAGRRWPEFSLMPDGSEPWIEGQSVALSLSPSPGWPMQNTQINPRARIDARLYTLPGDDLIRANRDLLVLPDAAPGTATSLIGPNAANPQTLNGLARTIAEDFAAKSIVRIDSSAVHFSNWALTLTVRAHAADRTKHTLTYSGPIVSSPPGK
ncbi:MAG TPA: hypothetical protein VJ597_02050 [Sphingomicrobium sp.]|nr:hypothetical protein [Sphingomicrobium sp.]